MQPTLDMHKAVKEHQQRLQYEADQARLALLAQAHRSSQNQHQPLLAELGRQLTNLGQRLEQAAQKQPVDVLALSRE